MFGKAGDDVLRGGAGNDLVSGEEGLDLIVGGQGNDILVGDNQGAPSSDTFKWEDGDEGASGDPAVDTVFDFHVGNHDVDREADKLDLGELLDYSSTDPDQQALDGFIHAEQQGSDTILYVKSDGGLAEGNTNADQKVILVNVNMDGQGSNEFLSQMIDQGQLEVE